GPRGNALPPASDSWQQKAAARLYSNYGLALDSYYGRRNGGLRDDPEQLRLSREERGKLERFARTRGMGPSELHTLLAAMAECEAHPRSAENLATRREEVREQLRLQAGSVEERDALLKRAVAFETAVAQEIPTLAARAVHVGAAEHPDVVRIGSRYPNSK